MILDHFTGKLLGTSLLLIVLTLTIDYRYGVLPISGFVLVCYILFTFCLTLWLTSKLIQKILSQTKPILYDFEGNSHLKRAKEWFLYLKNILSDGQARTKAVEEDSGRQPRNIDDCIDDFTKDVEASVRKWFRFISPDEVFLRETRNLVDDVVRRFLQVVVEVDGDKLLHGFLVILFNHVREYQKAVRRRKRKSGSIEELYRYTHVASNNDKTFEHIMCQLTNRLCRQFISWEVYSSVPCKAVVSILAKKLTSSIFIHVSSPPFLNYKLANVCCTKERRVILGLDSYDAISLTDVDLSETNASSAPQMLVASLHEPSKSESTTPKVSPKKCGSEIEPQFNGKISKETGKKTENARKSDEVDSGKPKSVPVKIYESKSSTKTWRNSSDLECISLGQDLLVLQDINDPDSEIQNLIGKKLWKDTTDFFESDDKQPTSSLSLEEPADVVKDFISNTIKPIGNATATTLQELQQTTVNNVVKPVSQATSSAMHRIGDLQDEAAGVMEGIFDFGMAGIRKGLRLTGLQDGADRLRADAVKLRSASTDPSPNEPKTQEKETRTRKLTKVAPVGSEDSSKSSEENVWVNPLTKESPNFDGHILLEKSVPSILTGELIDSPDLEYEDTTDLATTTAKLRSLLQQKTTESNLTTPAISPMPIDETGRSLSAISTSNDYPNSSVEDLTTVDGALPSLYKFCARTATGVFQNTINTLKTALPGNAGDQEGGRRDSSEFEDADNWTYVASDATQDDLSVRIEKLLNERRAFCVVDNAYEAVESLDVLDRAGSGWNTPTGKYDDDVDELEISIPLTKTLVDIFCELVTGSNGVVVPETVVKSLLILFGSLSERYLRNFGHKIVRSFSSFVGKIPTGSQQRPLALSIEDFAKIFLDLVPGYLKYIVGEETLSSAVKTFLSSLQCQKINQDVTLQIFELFSSLLIEANNKYSPTYSA